LAKILGTVTIIIAYMAIAGYQFKGGGRFIGILSEGAITPEIAMLIAAALIIASPCWRTWCPSCRSMSSRAPPC
jgi:SSS family solute:Na+ symporter/sodium/proline symporter